MASIEQLRPVPVEPAATFDSLDPSSGAVVATFPVDDAHAVGEAVARAATAAVWWRSLGFDGRAVHLRRYKSEIARRIDELADLIHRENGKPHGDAVLEITLVVDHLAWAAGHAKKVLGPHRVSSGLMAANSAASVEYQPLGVIGVIGPWNYPVFTPIGSIAYSLAAGNAVVFKPSEYTPAIGRWLVEAWARAVPDGPDVLGLVTGMGDTGAALCRSGVDKIAFTGSAATGRKVMGACAEDLVPVLMECGGKDALLVDADADLDAAADAALWCGMSNGGQTCIGTERVYVADAAYDRFVDLLTTKARDLAPGSGEGASWGPPTMPSQVDTIRRHVTDALARGGRAVVGGESSVAVSGVGPTILLDVPEDAEAVREETFGPTLTVTRVRDIEEGLALANASDYGLGGAVFTGSRRQGVELARRMRSGMTSVNSIITFAMVPGLPFGGVGESGFGRIHGPDGLREFTRPKAVTSQRFALPVNLTSFGRPEKATAMASKLMGIVHGRSR
ncbi:MAG TPA: aldehyde dehydrogenase family protein [Acidimicrobiales bacterium]